MTSTIRSCQRAIRSVVTFCTGSRNWENRVVKFFTRARIDGAMADAKANAVVRACFRQVDGGVCAYRPGFRPEACHDMRHFARAAGVLLPTYQLSRERLA